MRAAAITGSMSSATSTVDPVRSEDGNKCEASVGVRLVTFKLRESGSRLAKKQQQIAAYNDHSALTEDASLCLDQFIRDGSCLEERGRVWGREALADKHSAAREQCLRAGT